MDKKRLKIALSVLDFLKQMNLLIVLLKEECEKERITADEVIFYKFKSKKLAYINIFCFRFGTKVFIFFVYRYGKA